MKRVELIRPAKMRSFDFIIFGISIVLLFLETDTALDELQL